MSPLVLLPLLAAAVVAAPAPGLLHGGLVAPAGVAYAAPAVYTAQVQVPVTKTVHYGVQNVVTGYSTNIIKPALAAPALPGFISAAPSVVAAPAAPVAVADAPAAAPVQEAAPAPAPAPEAPASDDTEVVENVELRSAAAPAPAPAATVLSAAPAATVYSAAPAATFLSAAPAASVLAAPSLQRVEIQRPTPADVVTQEKVLAPVRTHTVYTPQITQIQPEVTVRKVIHDVPVATPVVAAPAFNQVVYSSHFAGSPVLVKAH